MELKVVEAPVAQLSSEAMHSELASESHAELSAEHSEMKSEAKSEALHSEALSEASFEALPLEKNSSLIANSSASNSTVIAPAPET